MIVRLSASHIDTEPHNPIAPIAAVPWWLLATAYAHCRPGGVVIALPDHTRETYAATTGHGGIDGVDGRGARFLEWSWDPDPADDTILTHYVMTLRERDGTVRVIHDQHVTGLFSIQTWVELLTVAGFDPVDAVEPAEPDAAPGQTQTQRQSQGPSTGQSQSQSQSQSQN